MGIRKRTYVYLVLLTALVILIGVVAKSRYQSERDFDRMYEGLRSPVTLDNNATGFYVRGSKACEYLIGRIRGEKDPMQKAIAVNIIGGMRCRNCGDRLTPFLRDENWRVRFMTIDTLDKLGYAQMLPILREDILRENDERVLRRAVSAIGKYGDRADLALIDRLARMNKGSGKGVSDALNEAASDLGKKSNQ
jgi:hypothetical protein